MVTTAAAVNLQLPEQGGTQDEPGDRIESEAPSLFTQENPNQPDFSQFTLRDEDTAPSGETIRTDVVPYPVSPFNEKVLTKTPKFYFTKYPGATKYRIQVLNNVGGALIPVYEFTGDPNCSSGTCWLKPTTALKVYDLTLSYGLYKWAVRAKVNGSWEPYRGFVDFMVISKGFTSTFDINMDKWLTAYGDWFRVSPGYLKTKGVNGKMSSVIRKEYFVDGFVYEVKMKRSADFTGGESNGLWFQANPYPLSDFFSLWNNGYFIYYTNTGGCGLAKASSGGLLYFSINPQFPSCPIKPYDWNKLTIWTGNGDCLDFWFNGKYYGYTCVEAEYQAGWVGIGTIKESDLKNPFLVDYAKLYYSTEPPPYPFPWAADGQRDPAYELQMVQSGSSNRLAVLGSTP